MEFFSKSGKFLILSQVSENSENLLLTYNKIVVVDKVMSFQKISMKQ